MEFKQKLGMHMTQAIAIYSSGNRYIRHNPLCLVESTAYPVIKFRQKMGIAWMNGNPTIPP